MYNRSKQKDKNKEPSGPYDTVPWYPAIQWEKISVTFVHEKPIKVMSVTVDACAAQIFLRDKNYHILPGETACQPPPRSREGTG